MSAPAAERTHLLDALRGFALFGVVFSNYAALAFGCSSRRKRSPRCRAPSWMRRCIGSTWC
ncbi:MAG: hypothetical protein IPK99_11805 [Flavobacteriales bacterium]|nr:hypothetical protein [Flavobacteriales bacterium]